MQHLCIIVKEGNSVFCYNVDEPQEHYDKQIKPVTKAQILYNSTHMKYLK